MKEILCIYHRSDLDGQGSAAIAYSVFGDTADYVGLEYGDPFDASSVDGKKVVMMDFSLRENPSMDEVSEKSELIWIDHHKTAEETFPEVWKNAEGKRSTEKSAIRLCWEYFYPEKEVPEAVLLIEDLDIWKFHYGERTRSFNAYASAELTSYENSCYDNPLWDKLFSDDKKLVDEWCGRGEALLKAEKIRVAKSFESVIERELWSHKVAVVNSNHDASKLGNYVVRNGYEIAVVWCVIAGGKVRVSLRSQGSLNVSEIAKQYGGGGHVNASGFTLNSISDFQKLVNLY